MLVGGGSESDASYGWSNEPYQWCVDQSINKRVAILSYDHNDSDQWLPNYFKNLGAVESQNIEVADRDEALLTSTYELLMGFDVFFFKGGNQARYYENYKDTEVSRAIVDKFNEGGVISGTSAGLAILSEVIFTAERGSVFPDETLANLEDDDLVLRDDFVSILEGAIVDSHFIERGRFGRLIPFLGKWYLDNQEQLLGIGVDDRTAVCIASDTATVYGTGAASFYQISTFDTDELRPAAEGVKAVSLLHNQQYRLSAKTRISDFSQVSSALEQEEEGNYQLFLSGDDPLSNNREMLAKFADEVTSPLILITERETNQVTDFINELMELGVEEIELVTTNHSMDACEQTFLRNSIRVSNSFLFLRNDDESLFDFLSNDETGRTLSTHLKGNDHVIGFVGQDSKYAGRFFCTNNLEDDLNAYFGELTFSEGLGLLNTTVVMPHTFSTESTDYYENNSAAVLWQLIQERLGYGLYINEASFVHYYQDTEGSNQMTSEGEHSSILIKNTSENAEQADQQVNSSGDIRQVVGFDELEYAIVSGQSIRVGTSKTLEDPNPVFELLPLSNLAAARAGNEITLTWDAPNDSLRTKVSVFRREPGAGFQSIAELSAGATIYVDENTVRSISYTYYVSSQNEDSRSCNSNEVEVSLITSVTNPASTFIYPNPAKPNSIIQFQGKQTVKSVTILNLAGQIVSQQVADGNQFYVPSKVESGTYILQLEGQEYIKTNKLKVE